MKTGLILRLVLALPAATAFAADSPAFPQGTYGAQGAPYTVSFEEQGQFHVNKEGKLEVSGTYSVKADELKLTDSAGPWACTQAGEQSGTYKWKFENAVLTLIKVSDKCADRVNSLVSFEWKQKT